MKKKAAKRGIVSTKKVKTDKILHNKYVVGIILQIVAKDKEDAIDIYEKKLNDGNFSIKNMIIMDYNNYESLCCGKEPIDGHVEQISNGDYIGRCSECKDGSGFIKNNKEKNDKPRIKKIRK